jgi:hypothetical protein
MNLKRAQRAFRIAATAVGIFMAGFLSIFLYLMLWRPDIIPASETFASFWVKNFSLLIAALAFAVSTLASAYNALEQRHLRFMENYPYLEVFPILSVDTLPLPIPRADLPPELETFNVDYLASVAPSQGHQPSGIEFRYLALVLRNVGHGPVTRVTLEGKAEVPNRGLPPVEFMVDRRVYLHPGDTLPFTLLPISGLPEYKVVLNSLRYYGHFVDLKAYEGIPEFRGQHPFEIPTAQRVTLLDDDFVNIPAGQGWLLDFWGQWTPTPYIFVPQPTQNEHYLLLSGDESLFAQIPHFNNQGGAFKDLMDVLPYGQTVEIIARVRSVPGTTASLQLWCHDHAPNLKNRYTEPLVPGSEWQEISMLFTATQSSNLRVHLLFTPGAGRIHVDRVKVEVLHS